MRTCNPFRFLSVSEAFAWPWWSRIEELSIPAFAAAQQSQAIAQGCNRRAALDLKFEVLDCGSELSAQGLGAARQRAATSDAYLASPKPSLAGSGCKTLTLLQINTEVERSPL